MTSVLCREVWGSCSQALLQLLSGYCLHVSEAARYVGPEQMDQETGFKVGLSGFRAPSHFRLHVSYSKKGGSQSGVLGPAASASLGIC